MLGYTQLIQNIQMLGILRRTFDHVDPRLIDHGARVAWMVLKMLRDDGGFCAAEQRDICLLALLHDIGAYKTEEIERLVQFETGDVWEHAVYGYLFMKCFSHFGERSKVILWHHADHAHLEMCESDGELCRIAQMVNICDRADVLCENGYTAEQFDRYLEANTGDKYSAQTVALYRRAGIGTLPADWEKELEEAVAAMPFAPEEVDGFLRMTVCVIDFRSRHTVTHALTTTAISRELAELMELPQEQINEVVCGALLHDLGKVCIPVEILESPDRLTTQQMAVMRTHVALTGEILGQSVSSAIRRIALRHHEKLDGSGYPLGLCAGELTAGERVVAVADIVSALTGSRSYKGAFSKERTLGIVQQMAADGQLDRMAVEQLAAHFDAVMERVDESAGPLLDTYLNIRTEYDCILEEQRGK